MKKMIMIIAVASAAIATAGYILYPYYAILLD